MKVPDVMTIKDALNVMRHEQVLRLPVVNADSVFQGMLSINDVVVDSEKETSRENENAETFFMTNVCSLQRTNLSTSSTAPWFTDRPANTATNGSNVLAREKI